jgi:hypothetical protein
MIGWELVPIKNKSRFSFLHGPLSWCDGCGQAKEAVQKAKKSARWRQGESRSDMGYSTVFWLVL